MTPHQVSHHRKLGAWMPFGVGQVKPQHFRDMAKIIWENRDNLGYAWQVLSKGVCEPRHLKQAIEFLRVNQERFPFHEMVSHRFTLDRANEALAMTANWQAAKSVFVLGLRP